LLRLCLPFSFLSTTSAEGAGVVNGMVGCAVRQCLADYKNYRLFGKDQTHAACVAIVVPVLSGDDLINHALRLA
jgi:hypothetical protein